jgi:hypothetical protein
MMQTSAPNTLGEESNLADAGQAGSQDEDFSRLESLLLARTRSHGNLQREVDRRNRLSREALERITQAVSSELSALRAGYESAVARAIEAEVARAELTFALDETRSQLAAAPTRDASSASSALWGGTVPSTESMRVPALERELASTAESWQQRLSALSSAHTTTGDALRGELNGLRARLDEAERALQSSAASNQTLVGRLAAIQERVDAARSESAEIALLAQSRANRIAELTQAAAIDQQEIRTLRAQSAAAAAAQVAQGEAREADRQLWAERMRQHEAREQEAWAAAGSAVARSESRLRAFLVSLERPLRQLDASLDAMTPTGPGRALAQADQTEPGTIFDGLSELTNGEGPRASVRTETQALPEGGRIADELARERTRRTQLAAAVRALQAATQSGEPTTPWIEELVALVSTESAGAPRRR